MTLDFLEPIFREWGDAEAIVWRDQSFSYAWLERRVGVWRAELEARGAGPGDVVAFVTDYSPESIALFLALAELDTILIPLSRAVAEPKRAEFARIARPDLTLEIAADGTVERAEKGVPAPAPGAAPSAEPHAFYRELRRRSHPGLVLFSSGSTGEPKAAVHDLFFILKKFRVRRHRRRTIPFLLFDHIGGLNTMLYALSNGGALVLVADRQPETVLRAIERHRVELLPTTPTFLNLLLLSGDLARTDLSSLQVVTYGTEPMPETTLKRLHELYPRIHLQQTYGMTELGILRSKSERPDSLWMKMGGEGFETRVVDSILQIRAESAMLGYLNAPSPFTADGWFVTGDRVEVRGDEYRVLGRDSKLINVGGEKVYPTEVESVIQTMPNVLEVTVFKEANAIMGNIVCCKVRLREPEDAGAFKARLKRFCAERLERFKVPVKIEIVDQALHSERMKKR